MYSVRKFKDKFIIYTTDSLKINNLKKIKLFKVFSILKVDKKVIAYEFEFKLPQTITNTVFSATEYVKKYFDICEKM